MSREEMNKAIWEVLTHQYKKDAKEAHKLVSSEYEVEKWNGSYHVRNPKTRRTISYNAYNRRGGYILYGAYAGHRKDVNGAVKFDFVGCLEKPENFAWYEMVNKEYEQKRKSKSKERYEKLRYAVRNIKWEEDAIESIKKQMEKLQKDMEWHEARLQKAQGDYIKVREELGLEVKA